MCDFCGGGGERGGQEIGEFRVDRSSQNGKSKRIYKKNTHIQTHTKGVIYQGPFTSNHSQAPARDKLQDTAVNNATVTVCFFKN